MRQLFNKAFNNADLVLALVAILSLSFNVYLFVQQSKRVETVALETEKKRQQISQAMRELTTKQTIASQLRDGLIELKFLNYELLSICANKNQYTPAQLRDNIQRNNFDRLHAVKEFLKSHQSKEIFMPLFTQRVYDETVCNVKWNFEIFEKILNQSENQCEIIQISEIPYCTEHEKLYSDFCMSTSSSGSEITFKNFDKVFDKWHGCQSHIINEQVTLTKNKVGKLIGSADMD